MNRLNGFTLIELMITVVIISILAGIAYPSYTDHVMKSRRADAKGALMAFANAMEKHFTVTNSYCNAATTTTTTAGKTCTNATGSPTIFPTQSPLDGATKYYDLTVSAATATTYTLAAARTGAQSTDKCGTLTLTHTGVKGVTGQDTGITAADCW